MTTYLQLQVELGFHFEVGPADEEEKEGEQEELE